MIRAIAAVRHADDSAGECCPRCGRGEGPSKPGWTFYPAIRSSLAYQPIVNVESQSVFGYEALLRPQNPDFQSPSQLLAAAERIGLLSELGRSIRETAAAAALRLPRGTSVLVNLHPRDLLDDELYDAKAPLSAIASRVILEINERSVLEEVASAQTRFERLRKLGFRLAIDDLGAGYAGLNSWAQIKPNLVKLDMTLVRGIHLNPLKRSLVKAIVDVCRDLGVLLIAEGIESAKERDTLIELRCPLMQGFLFGRPEAAFPDPRFN
jgi:EAL domain-containing protein (putative c-di-GMP-specific phosphodiesterase class I)